MPKIAKELTPQRIKDITRPGLYAVGHVSGLQLYVAPGGSRSWILRTLIGSKRRDIGLGGYPDTTLAQARERARVMKDKIRQGIDPVEEKRAARIALLASQAKQLSFEDAARECHMVKAPEFRNAKHKAQWINTLETYAFPTIGRMPVSEIELPHVLQVLKPIWHTKTETASRIRQRIESVLTWATVSGFRSGENPARWEGNLKEVLPAASKINNRKHHTALPFSGVASFMADLRKREGMAARALEFTIITASRSGEVRGMTWDEINLDSKVWTVPAERIKAGKQHKVPLSAEAIKLLKALPRFEKTNHVFPSRKGGPMSDMSLTAVMRRMGVDAVPHGFRSTFKDWARSCTSYPDEVSELALAHVNSDATRAAYARDELLPKRTRMMADWAKYCSNPQKSGDVVPMKGKLRRTA